MAPETVRTIPPWVIQRPPQSLQPQHNHSPSEPRQRRNDPDRPSNSSDRDADNADDADADGLGMSGTKEVGGTRAVDGAIDPAVPVAAGKEESPDRGIGQRLTHLFRGKEGRKWDHLRSSEPVIVPQFHVVNGSSPATRAEENERRFEERRRSRRETGQNGEASRKAARDAIGADGPSSLRSPRTSTAIDAGLSPLSASTSATASGTSPHAVPSGRKSSSPAHARQTWWYNPETQWRGFIESSRYPHSPNEKSEIVDDEEMARLHPDFGYNGVIRPKAGGGDGGGGVGHFHHSHKRSKYSDKAFYERIWQTLLHHPLGPLACRLTVLMTSIVALIIAVTIFRHENLGSLSGLWSGDRSSNDISELQLADMQQERSQIIVAIVVDVVAIPYIGYITVDDYTGKPLGLRPTQARIRLILTDLFFIIFKSASTALGFEAMIYFKTDQSQGLLRALGSFELIGLVSWALTLTINIFREIARLGG
ncbi:hypothetical protein SBRCBS47491_000108 [Sporothrix bragantina]|uniref:Uncharacterized protein n=1 Tax=Sporothrix bragantina TaxID=671064 RepID=A0ABP0AL06_9PEZI